MRSKQFALAALAAILVSPASDARNPIEDALRNLMRSPLLCRTYVRDDFRCRRRDWLDEMHRMREAARQIEASEPVETAIESQPVEDVSPGESASSLSE